MLGGVIDAKAMLVAISMIHPTTVCCKLPECHKQMSSRDVDKYSLTCRWHRIVITTELGYLRKQVKIITGETTSQCRLQSFEDCRRMMKHALMYDAICFRGTIWMILSHQCGISELEN